MTNFFQQSESDAADDSLEAQLQEATGRTISLNPKDFVNSNLLTWPEVLERIELGLSINEGEILPPIPSGLTATEFYNATGISATTFSQPPFSDFTRTIAGSSAVSTPTTTALQTAEQATVAQQVRIGQRSSAQPLNPETDADEDARQKQNELDGILGYGKDTGLGGLVQSVLGVIAPYGTGLLFQTSESPFTVMGGTLKEWWTGTPSGWEEHATLNNAAQVWAALDKGIITEQQANAFYTNGPGKYYADGAGAIGDRWERPNEDQIRGASGLYDKDFHITGGVGSVDPLLGLDSDYMPRSIQDLVERNRQALFSGSEAPYSGVLLNSLAAAQVFSDKSFAGKECELRIKFAVDKEIARMGLLLDSTKVSLETVEKKYNSIITIKDNEIKRLSDLAMKDKTDYSALWFTGGALAGIALTVAVIYAVQEAK